jgi:hypothetical protein
MHIIHTDKWRYEIQEQKEVPLWYTDIYRPILSTDSAGIYRYISSTDYNDK